MDKTAPVSSGMTWESWLILIATVFVLGVVVLLIRKGRALPGEHVFRASRWSRGNRLLPAQVVLTPSSITLYKPQWIGKLEESIHMAHIASVKIDTNLVFSNVFIETSGGHDPIKCHGHTKGDAIEMKRLIEKYQTDYYRASGTTPAAPPPPSPKNP
jgi:hypothetical protein